MPTHFQGDETTRLALDTFIKLTRSAGAFENRLLHGSELGNLTLSQFGVLETLHHLGPLCQGQISAKLLKSSGNITLVLDNLEKHGLVQRVRDREDRRKVTLNLTPAGEALIAEIFPRQAALIAKEMSVLTPEEQETLGRLCKKLGKGAFESPTTSFDNQNSFSVS